MNLGDDALAAKLVELKKTKPPTEHENVNWNHNLYYVCAAGNVFRTGTCRVFARELATKFNSMVWEVTTFGAVMLYDFTPKEAPCKPGGTNA